MSEVKKVVLAYSGGLDTSVMITWLKEHYNCEVIAFSANIGQDEDWDAVREKALKTGASKVYIEDMQDEFIRDYIFPTMRAGAVYEDKYLLGTSFARPLIAKRQIEIAQQEGADAVAHGATGKGNDQVRFELGYMAMDPSIKIIAPWKDDKWTIRSREDAIKYAEEHGIPLTFQREKTYSEDANAWHISHEGYDLENPWTEPGKGIWTYTNALEDAPDEAEYVTLRFNNGNPVAVNGESLGPAAIVAKLNEIGGKHAVGQVDIVENRLVGMKSRGVYENPGGSIIYEGHRAIESLVLDRDTYHYKQQIALKYADLVYNGQWFCTLRESLDAFVATTQQYASGEVRLKLYKGNAFAVGVKSPHSLYSEALATFEEDDVYDQKDANGFIRLFGLPIRSEGVRRRGA